MPKGFVYILECHDGTFYTGSTIDLEKRVSEHQEGKGANHTKKRLPVTLVYYQEFQRIDDAFYREKQIQGWNRNKKEALIKGNYNSLPKLSIAYRDKEVSSSSASNKKTTSIVSGALEDSKRRTLYSNGKLLLTGEYVVLDGAEALALPTKYGQSLTIEIIDEPKLIWQSFDDKGNIWYEDQFIITNNEIQKQGFDKLNMTELDNSQMSKRLIQILNAAKQLNPLFLNNDTGFHIKTKLDFPKNWGLGTSSTLINNIANWADVDAYKLLDLTFGGSGYDIACTKHDTAITYKLEKPFDYVQDDMRVVKKVDFNPEFRDNLYFVYLNKKQNSREGIAHYKANTINNTIISEITDITLKLIKSNNLNDFESLINLHEEIISKTIKQKPVKNILFKDFKGSIKSLGAWGGDFVLATSVNNPTLYFETKGFKTVIPYTDMIL